MAKKKNKKAAAAKAPERAKENEVKGMEIPNLCMTLLYTLLNIPLHGAQSRARNRVGQFIKDRLMYIEDERIKLLEARAEKDKDDKPKLKPEVKGQDREYDVTPEEMVEYRKEFNTFMHEPTIFDLVPSMKTDLVVLRPLVLESRFPLETADGYNYETICKAFESI